MKIKIIFFLLLFPLSLLGQEISLYDIDSSAYPIIKAKFHPLDKDKNVIKAITKSDVKVTENDVVQPITKFKVPGTKVAKSSVVLTFDISGSMSGGNLSISKKAAHHFVNLFPIAHSEIAITSFDTRSSIQTDFTQNQTRLQNSIQQLKASGGTDYNAGFNELTGSIELAKRGKHTKHIIFLTDGLSSVDVEKVTKNAKSNGVTIHCVALNMPMPADLKQVTANTGGQYYENVSSIRDIKKLYEQLAYDIQQREPYLIEWKSNTICETNRQVSLAIPSLDLSEGKGTYSCLQVGLSSPLQFLLLDKKEDAKYIDTTILFMSKGRDVIINAISFGHIPVKLLDKKLPLTIPDGTQERLNIRIDVKKLKHNVNKLLTINTQQCDPFSLPISILVVKSLTPPKVKLLTPNGGEQFISGGTTEVTWSGVPEDTPVFISYSLDSGKSWKVVPDTIITQPYRWKIPYAVTNNALLRLSKGLAADYKLAVKQDTIRVTYPSDNSYFNEDTIVPSIIAVSTDASKVVLRYTNNNVRFYDQARLDYIIDLNTRKLVNTYQKTQNKSKYKESKSQEITFFSAHGDSVYYSKIKQYISSYSDFRAKPEIFDYLNKLSPRRTKYGQTRIKRIGHNHQSYTPDLKYTVLIYSLSTFPKRLLTIKKSDLQLFDFSERFALIKNDRKTRIEMVSIPDKKKTILDIDPVLFPTIVEGYINPTGEYVFLNDGTNLHVYQVATNTLMYSFPTGILFKNKFRSSKDFMAIPLGNKSVALHDIHTGTLVHVIQHVDAFEFNQESLEVLQLIPNGIVRSTYQAKNLGTGMDISDSVFSISIPTFQGVDLAFGEVIEGTQQDKVFSKAITNLSIVPIEITHIELEDGNFNLRSHPGPFIIPAQGSASIEFSFQGTSVGNHRTNFTIYSPFDTLQYTISGAVKSAGYKVNQNIIYLGELSLGQEKDTTIRQVVQNLSKRTVTIEPLIIGPDEEQFKLRQSTLKIRRDRSSDLKVSFQALKKGRTTTEVTLSSNTSNHQEFLTLVADVTLPHSYRVVGDIFDSRTKEPIDYETIRCYDSQNENVLLKNQSGSPHSYSYTLNPERIYVIETYKDEFLIQHDTVEIKSLFDTLLTQDIYLFPSPDALKPTEYRLVGDVKEIKTKKSIRSKITISHQKEKASTIVIDSSYKGYKATLEKGIKWTILAEAEGYFPSKTTLWVSRSSKEKKTTQDLYLKPVRYGEVLNLDNVLFQRSKAILLNDSSETLDMIVKFLNEHPTVKIKLFGHTDNSGGVKSNLKLSNQRVKTIETYLIDKGIHKKRISGKGFGGKKPLVKNSTEANRRLNRRVEFIITKKD